MLATDLGKSSPGKARSRQLETYVHMCINFNRFFGRPKPERKGITIWPFWGFFPRKVPMDRTHQGATVRKSLQVDTAWRMGKTALRKSWLVKGVTSARI